MTRRPQQGPLSTEVGSTGFLLLAHLPEHWRAHSRQKSCSEMRKKRHFIIRWKISLKEIKKMSFFHDLRKVALSCENLRMSDINCYTFLFDRLCDRCYRMILGK